MFEIIRRHFGKIKLVLLLATALQVAACGSPEDRARGYLEHGLKLLAEHDNDKASIEFKNAIKIKKDMIDAWKGLAQIAEDKKQWPDLIATLKTIVQLDPKDVPDRVKLAKLLLLGGSIDDALKLVNEAYELDNKDVGVLTLKAAVLFKLDDHDGAAREAKAALAIDPRSAEAAVVLAANRMATGDAKGALQILDSDPVAHSNELGIDLFKLSIFEQTKDLKSAEIMLRKLSELYPKQVAFRRLLVKTYLDQNRPDDAEKEVRAIVAANPDDVEAELDLVRLLYSIKGPDAAKQELAARISAGGAVFPFQLASADIDLAKGNFADAIKLIEGLTTTGTADNRIAAQVKLAQIYVGQKNFDQADAVISDVLRKDHRNIGALRFRATIRMEHGQLEPAIADLREAINDQPQAADLLEELAVAYERNGTIELAEKQYADATRVSGFKPDVGLAYVAFLRRRGSIQRAEDVLVELNSRWPKNIDILSAMAEIKLTRQDWVGAQELGEKIRQLGNIRGVGDQILGAALAGRNKLDESINVLQSAYDASPSAVQPMFALVRALVRAKKVDRAISFLQSVLKANPTSAEAYALLGAIELTNNAPDRAVKDFNLAIEKQPKEVVGYRALAEFYLSQKKANDALKVVESGLQMQPGNSTLRLMKAGILETKGDFEGAIAEYQRMLQDEPGSLIVANNLASMLADHRTDKASLDQAKSLVGRLRKSPVPQFKDTVGWVSYREGDYKDALSALEEASTQLPNLAVVRYHLGMSYVSSGDLAKATEQLKLALQQAPDAELREKIEAALKKAGS